LDAFGTHRGSDAGRSQRELPAFAGSGDGSLTGAEMIRAVVHWDEIWIYDVRGLAGHLHLQLEDFKQLIKLLLDAGIIVTGYYTDINYQTIDERLGYGIVRRP
jgi:hypothetical protein